MVFKTPASYVGGFRFQSDCQDMFVVFLVPPSQLSGQYL
jgi:hypothetical protein